MLDGDKGKGRVGGFTKNIELKINNYQQQSNRFDSNDVILRLN